MKKALLVILAATICLAMNLAGSQKREHREIGSEFSGLEFATHGELQVTVGERVELIVEADEEMLPLITTRVRGNVLVIDRKSRASNWFRELFRSSRMRRMRFYLTVLPGQIDHLVASSHGDIVIPELKGKRVGVELSSHGEVEIDEIKADSVRIYLSSHGDLNVRKLQAESLRCEMSSHGLVRIRSGRVRNQIVDLSSHGDYLAEGLECEEAMVELSSHGTAKIYATEKLEASITSHGDLYYRGNPDLDIPRSQMKRVRSIR